MANLRKGYVVPGAEEVEGLKRFTGWAKISLPPLIWKPLPLGWDTATPISVRLHKTLKRPGIELCIDPTNDRGRPITQSYEGTYEFQSDDMIHEAFGLQLFVVFDGDELGDCVLVFRPMDIPYIKYRET